MDEDLDGMSREQLAAEVAKLRDGIRRHRDSTGHELCWHHPALWSLLPEPSDPLPQVPDWPEFLRGCIHYRQSLDEQAPHAPRSHEAFDASGITEAEVVAFLKAFETASGTESFANVRDMIHPNALFRFNDGDHRGLEAIQSAFQRTWAYDVKDERYTLSNIEVISVDTRSAAATFTFTWSGHGPEGPFHIVGRGTTLLVRHHGRLQILVEHLSR